MPFAQVKHLFQVITARDPLHSHSYGCDTVLPVFIQQGQKYAFLQQAQQISTVHQAAMRALRCTQYSHVSAQVPWAAARRVSGMQAVCQLLGSLPGWQITKQCVYAAQCRKICAGSSANSDSTVTLNAKSFGDPSTVQKFVQPLPAEIEQVRHGWSCSTPHTPSTSMQHMTELHVTWRNWLALTAMAFHCLLQRLATIVSLIPALGPTTRLLDVGSGTGCLIPHLQSRGVADITAVDLSPAMLEQLAARFPAPSVCGNEPGEASRAAQLLG